MDFGNVAVLTFMLVGLVALVKKTFPTLSPRAVPWVALALSIGVVWLVGATFLAHSQVIGEKSLDLMSTADKFLIGIGLGLFSTQVNRVLKVGANIGENNADPPE